MSAANDIEINMTELSQQQIDTIRANLKAVIDNNSMTDRDALIMSWGVVAALEAIGMRHSGWVFMAAAGRPIVDGKPYVGSYELRSNRSRDSEYFDVEGGEVPSEQALEHLGYYISAGPVDRPAEEEEDEDESNISR